VFRMGLFKLNTKETGSVALGILERVIIGNIDYERDFENWLENSPDVLFDEDEGNTVIWIGRQVRAGIGSSFKYPDLMGIDSSGDIVIVELKKGKTPREVVAQALEYSSWVSKLNYQELNDIFLQYKKLTNKVDQITDLLSTYKEVFYPDLEEDIRVEINNNQKIFIVAEEVTSTVKQVTTYLRNSFGVEIYCLEYKVYKTEQGEYIISTEQIGSKTDIVPKKTPSTNIDRWNKPIRVKDAVHQAVLNYTNNDINKIFSPSDIYKELIKEYEDMNPTTVRCQIITDCVNHTSRRHYPSGQRDLYFNIEKGKYRLYNEDKDGKWNWEGKPV
jgi:hypothetical protein